MIQKRRYAVDRYHSGIRIAVLIALAVGTIIGAFEILPVLAAALGLTQIPPLCFNGIGGLLIGAGAGWLTEQALFRIWPSGRTLDIDASRIELGSNSGEPARIEWGKLSNVLSWHFVVPRTRTFVPRGWYCLACRLTQGEQVISVYTFSSPDDAKKLPQWRAFEHLISQKDATGPGSEHLIAIVADQGQMRAAERDRWEAGVEMSRSDFYELMATIDAQIEHWPDKSVR